MANFNENRTGVLKDAFLQDCEFRGLSPDTIKDYRKTLAVIEDTYGPCENVTRQQIKELVLRKLSGGMSPASANHIIRAIKAFSSFLCKEEFADSNIMRGLPLVSMPEKLKPVLEPRQVSSIISSIPDRGFYNRRDRAMIWVLFDTAIRLKELLNVKLNDIDLRFGTMKITGKGRKDRIVPIGRKAKAELIKFIKIRGESSTDYLFSTRTGERIMSRNFERSLANHGKKVGIKVNPHLLRHSAATFLAKAEMPAQHIQLLLGHTSLSVTQNYINRLVAQEGLQISHRRLSPGDRI